MSRKSLIICLTVLAVMVAGIGLAITVLYSGTEGGLFRKEKVVPDQERFLLLPAVPADAVFVACISDLGNAGDNLLSGYSFVSELSDSLKSDSFRALADVPMTVSLHYNGALQALYVFDAGRASSEPSEEVSTLMGLAEARGMYAEYADCSRLTDSRRSISRRSVVLVSKSETLIRSSVRHLEKSISVMEATGFVEASGAVSGSDVMFFSNFHARMLMSGMFSEKYASFHPFVANMAQWTVAEILKSDDSGTYMTICPVYGNDPSEYMTVLAKSEYGESRVSRILPSYTLSAVSFPMKDMEPFVSAYQRYMDSKQLLQSYRRKQKNLETVTGLNPLDFFRRLEVREVAKATFMTGGRLEDVNLIRIGREDNLILAGSGFESFKDYEPCALEWPYAKFTSSVFGKYFELEDESYFTYIDGWIISGGRRAVEEYAAGKALNYNLTDYMADAGQKDMLASESPMLVYYSFTEYPKDHDTKFSKAFSKGLKPYHEDSDYCPLVMKMSGGKDGLRMNVRMPKLTVTKTKAPEFVRDTTVNVPTGPFKVKNSGTGKMNLFYQNSHGSLCLQEEGGKNLWGVSFSGKLCGTAYNVDCYANGKLQIIFGSGTKIYIIDRLGRFVSGFPIDLGREILLGPDVYDFNGRKAYNIMVLHKDNTIEMYNLKGKRPASWKTIKAPETIKALPERLELGGKTFWIVRTAIRTLIYPFEGGTPLTEFKDDQMIRPDSEIKILDATSVAVECYDGRTRTVKLKEIQNKN